MLVYTKARNKLIRRNPLCSGPGYMRHKLVGSWDVSDTYSGINKNKMLLNIFTHSPPPKVILFTAQ